MDLKKENKFSCYLLLFVILTIHQLIHQPFIYPNENNFLDYNMFMQNWITGKIWFNKNFLSIPWFTPAQCMSFPFYPNPQNLYYSISQIFFIIFKPTDALRVYFLFLSVIGVLSCYLCVRKILNCSRAIAIVGSTLFLFNGFFNERFLVAHFGVVVYMFVPLYIYLICKAYKCNKANKKYFLHLVLSSLVLAQIIHSGSAALTPHIFLSIFTILLFLIIYQYDLKILKHTFFSFSLFLCLSASKIIAGVSILKILPRLDHLTPVTDESILSVIKTLVAGLFFYKFNDMELVYKHVHELNYSVTFVPIVIILSYIVLNFKNLKITLNTKQKYCLLFLSLLLLFPIIVNFESPLIKLISYVPVLKDLWVNYRFFLIYPLLLIFLSCLCLKKINFKYSNYFLFLLIGLIFVQSFFTAIKVHKGYPRTQVDYNNESYLEKINKKNYKIDKILFYKNEEIPGAPSVIFTLPYLIDNNSTDFFCYEPLFGYRTEMRPLTKLLFSNPKSKIKNKIQINKKYLLDPYWNYQGIYNFNNPMCLLFPEENLCEGRGDNLKIDEKNKLEKLLNFKPINFKKSIIQKIADIISFITFVSVVLFCIFFYFTRLIRFYKK